MPKDKKVEKEIQKVAKQLAEVGMYLTESDKRKAAANLDCHPKTVNEYISGKIARLPFALKLLAELKALRKAIPA